jgi:alpha/beta superfamily hydrolase
MHNHATYRLARAVRRAGGTSLRFQFRGVGRSSGEYSGGPGEVEDARAALAHLRALDPTRPLLACGFSFGAWVAGECAGEPGVVGLVLAGLALRAPELDSLRRPDRIREVTQPLAVIQAQGDELGAPAEVRALIAGSAGPRRLSAVPGTTHLFGEDLDAFERETSLALAWVLAEARDARSPSPAGGPP